MRKRMHQRFSASFAFMICLLMLFNTFIILNYVAAQDEKRLIIWLFDPYDPSYEPYESNFFYEGKEYDIAVSHEGGIGYAYNVTITITAFEEIFVTSEELPVITIQTPSFEEHRDFLITASKEGHISDEIEIVVIKGELSVSTDKGIVEEAESFQVTIVDQDENEVEESTVYLDIDGQEMGSQITNADGIVYLEAPEVDADTDINIIAFKNGYKVGSKTIRVENIPIGAFINDVAYIIVPIIAVIFAMLFVRFRKRISKPVPEFKIDISKERFIEEKKIPGKTEQKEVHPDKKAERELPVLEKGPRVEEIRIHRPDNTNETEEISGEKELEKAIPLHKKDEYEWFQGTDYMRYKIDELTGETAEKKADKWFEGVDDIRSKVDKKLKKSSKKKDK